MKESFQRSKILLVPCPLLGTGTLRPVRPRIARKTGKPHLGLKIKIAKKDSRSVGDLRETLGQSSHMVTGAIDTQQQIPEFLTGRIHSIPNLQRQHSNHNVSLDATLPAPDPEVPEPQQDPFNRLADVLVNLQNKPQTMTIRPVQTTPGHIPEKVR